MVKHRAYVRKLGSRCHGKDGKVRRHQPGGGAFGPIITLVVVVVVIVVTVSGRGDSAADNDDVSDGNDIPASTLLSDASIESPPLVGAARRNRDFWGHVVDAVDGEKEEDLCACGTKEDATVVSKKKIATRRSDT